MSGFVRAGEGRRSAVESPKGSSGHGPGNKRGGNLLVFLPSATTTWSTAATTSLPRGGKGAGGGLCNICLRVGCKVQARFLGTFE